MNLVARLWTPSRHSTLCLEVPLQRQLPNSRSLLIRARYRALVTFTGALKPTVRFNQIQFSIALFDNIVYMSIPIKFWRYFNSKIFNGFNRTKPSVVHEIVKIEWITFPGDEITWHLEGWKFNSQVLLQSTSALRSFWSNWQSSRLSIFK